MGRWLERLTRGKYRRLVFEAKTVTATRVLTSDRPNEYPMIEMTFVMTSPTEDRRTGEILDEVRILVRLDIASQFGQQLVTSIEAATPRVPRPSYRTPFE